MKSKRLISIILCIILAISFASCIKKAEPAAVSTTAAPETTTAAEVTAAAVEVKSEEISFYDAKDSEGNTLKLSPIYAKDGKTVVAAYIVSATSKDKKALDSKAFPLLNSVVAATSSEKGIALTYDASKKLVKVESYADKNGNMIAIQDVGDANKNGNKTEYLKLTKKTNEKGSVHYLLTDEVVEVKKENGKTVVVDKGKKTEVKTVDSKNKTVADKTKKDTASDKEKKQQDEKKDSTTSSNTPEEKAYINIVLKKNGKASCSSSKVEIKTNEVIINEPDDYKITSETDEWHGGIKVKLKNTEEAELRFEDVNISYNKGNIIQLIDESDTSDRSFIETEVTGETMAQIIAENSVSVENLSDRESAPNVSLTFPTGTSSKFESSAKLTTGVIYNESKLTIKGNGKASLVAHADTNNVISSSKSITVKNLNLYLESAGAGISQGFSHGGARGIHSFGKVNVESGTLSINTNGDAIRCDSFKMTGGSANVVSSACDGIDADDAVLIEGGSLKVKALDKTGIKVRRVNIQDIIDSYEAAGESVSAKLKKDGIRADKEDGFRINGGTVRAECKKTSTPRDTKQKVIICKSSRKKDGSEEDTKKPLKWQIGSLASSENMCIKFLYSSSKVTNKEYTITTNDSKMVPTWNWNKNVGTVNLRAKSEV